MGKNPKQKCARVEPKPTDYQGVGTKRGVLSLFGSLILCLLPFLVCLFAGCESEENLASMSAEEKKAALLEQLNVKFENPDVHYELGQLYQAEGNWAKAEYHYNVALGFDPVHRPTQAAIVKGLIGTGDKAKAEQYAKTYINQASSSATASLQLAEAFNKQQLDGYALTCYQQAINLGPNSPEVHKQVGYYYLSKNDVDQAKEHLSRSFQLNPNQPDVAGELGRLGVTIKIPERN
jgi:tetratricopeptide (TPR) repeat protein